MHQIYSTPSRQKTFDNNFANEDIMNFQQDFQPQPNQGSAKRKSHNPLCLNSSNFMVKGVNPSMFQDSASTTFDSTDVTHSSVASEPLHRSSYFPTQEHLDLNSFKIKPCPINTQHNHKHCPFYHNAKDRKRLGFFYSAELCEYAEKESVSCPNGDSCMKAHNRVEQLYRPDKYKTKFCTFFPHNLEKCDYANFCSFAHNEYDIATELIHNYEYDDDFYMFHFKTVWCPFNLTQHDKALCVYAHNWQDYRRKPNVCVYDPAPCPNWKSTDFILNYEDGCCFREKCNKCHGWKELEYHPFNYRSKPCPAKNCAKGRDCPYYHHPFERRTLSANVLNRVFKYAPRNRIITNTFKVRSEERVPSIFLNQQNSMSNPSSATFSSLVFSQDGDSFQDQFPSLTEQMLNNPPRSGTLNMINEVPDKIFDFRAKPMDEPQVSTSLEFRYRKQSYDFQGPQQSIGGGNMMQVRGEFLPVGLDIKDPRDNNRTSYAKARRWSAHEDDRFNNENDKLFREIFMSSLKKESFKNEHDEKASPMNRNDDEKELGAEAELKNTIMLEKILESEDA